MTATREWGSDAVAAVLEAAGVGLVTYMPGSTMRGLLETLSSPERRESLRVVHCLHESSAVAIAHGYTKTSGRPAAVLLHSNVGLLNAAMAIFNAALDFAPLLLLVGVAPHRPEHRRPWIDRIHAGQELADLAADLVKRASVTATLDEALDGVLEGVRVAADPPRGPVAIFIDRDVLEERASSEHTGLPPKPYHAHPNAEPDPDSVAAVAGELARASHPVALAGHLGLEGWDERVLLAEATGLVVLTDLRLPGAFPTGHQQYAGGLDLQGRPFGDAATVLRKADVVLSLDWADPRGISDVAGWASRPPEALFDIRLDDLLPAPLAARAERFPVEHRRVTAAGQQIVSALIKTQVKGDDSRQGIVLREAPGRPEDSVYSDLSLAAVAAQIREALGARPRTLVKVPVEWRGAWWEIDDARDYLGYDGGGGLGSGPGLLVGAALGLEMGRLALAVLGDGDVLMGLQALWTAAVAEVAALVIVVDNQGFGTEAHHLQKMMDVRARPADWEEQAFPFRRHPVDIGGLARDLGMTSFGPANDLRTARECIESGLRTIRAGRSALIHLRIV